MKLAALVLAAGASRRLGRPKQLEPHQGETLVHRTARMALQAGFEPVMVVVGCRAEAVQAALQDLPTRTVFCPDWEEGMGASLRAGVTALPPGLDGTALLVCDQLALDLPVLAALQAAFREAPDRPAAAAYGGTTGVPALFPAPWFPDLLELAGDQGARRLLRNRPVSQVFWPEGSLDLDVPPGEPPESMPPYAPPSGSPP